MKPTERGAEKLAEVKQAGEVIASVEMLLALNDRRIYNRPGMEKLLGRREEILKRLNIMLASSKLGEQIGAAPSITMTGGAGFAGGQSKASMSGLRIDDEARQAHIRTHIEREKKIASGIDAVAAYVKAQQRGRQSLLPADYEGVMKDIEVLLAGNIERLKEDPRASFTALRQYGTVEEGPDRVAGELGMKTIATKAEMGAVLLGIKNTPLEKAWEAASRGAEIGGIPGRPEYRFFASTEGGMTVDMPKYGHVTVSPRNIKKALEVILRLQAREKLKTEDVYAMLTAA